MRNDEQDVIDIVNQGLAQGKISIPSADLTKNNFKNINSVSQYLNEYGTVIAERIKDSFLPLYDPTKEDICPMLKDINKYLKSHTGYELYPAQLAVAESVKRRLEKAKVAMIIAECGSGKTKSARQHWQRIRTEKRALMWYFHHLMSQKNGCVKFMKHYPTQNRRLSIISPN